MTTFEQARIIAADSAELRRWFASDMVEISEWGWENRRDYLLDARAPREPWPHEFPTEEVLIPGPPLVVVSKSTGALRVLVGGEVPCYTTRSMRN